MRGGDQVFVDFVHARSASLFRTACLLVADRALAEDLLQQALLRAYVGWGRLRDPTAAEAYVRTILVRSAISWRRRRAWESEVLVADPPEQPTSDEVAGIDERRTLLPLLRSLTARQRAVLVLRYYEDMSEEQIASTLGCSRGAVKSHTARAMSRLRTALVDPEPQWREQ